MGPQDEDSSARHVPGSEGTRSTARSRAIRGGRPGHHCGDALSAERMSWLAVRDCATGPASKLKPLERLVALCLASHLRDNASAWPSLRTIGRWTGLSVSTTRRILTVLCAEGGLFQRERRGRLGAYEYRLSPAALSGLNSVQAEQGSVRAPGVFRLTAGSVQPDNRKRKEGEKEGGAAPPPREGWLSEAREAWADSVGAPPSWFDADIRPLVTPSRTSEEVLAALRIYLASVAPDKAGTGDFSRRIGAWMTRGAKPEAKGEPYRGTQEQLAEKSRRYLGGAA